MILVIGSLVRIQKPNIWKEEYNIVDWVSQMDEYIGSSAIIKEKIGGRSYLRYKVNTNRYYWHEDWVLSLNDTNGIPLNNDYREKCFWCKGNTKSIGFQNHTIQYCPKCQK